MSKMTINLTKPSLDARELNAVKEVLDSGWLIRGKNCKALEEEFAAFNGAKYGVATNGCTMALYIAVKQLGLKPEDEVIVPSLTWSATAAIVIHAGATPIFADVDPHTWCLDSEDVKRKMTKNTKLVIPVHYAGRFAEGYEQFDVPVIYDSAHRIKKDDFKGITSCYSFYAVKNMTTVRGGMILTNDEETWKWYNMLCHGGVAKDTLARYQGANSKPEAANFYYEVEVPAWNFDMTDVEAAIGRVQLTKLEELDRKRDDIVATYNKAFGLSNSGNHLYPLLVEDRDTFLVSMKEQGIQCGIHYLPLHQMKGYQPYNKESLPVTEFIGTHTVSIPLHAEMTTQEIEYVIDTAKKCGKLIKQ